MNGEEEGKETLKPIMYLIIALIAIAILIFIIWTLRGLLK